MDRRGFPRAAVERLPKYLKILREMQEQGIDRISSSQIGDLCGSNSAQVRKDFSYIGVMGMIGSGYGVTNLLDRLVPLIGVETPRKGVLVGYGRLGAALLAHGDYMSTDLQFVAVFDSDAEKIGTEVGGFTIRDVEELGQTIQDEDIDVTIVTTPPEQAQGIADRVVGAGGRAILNMTPQHVEVPEGVHVRHSCLCNELHALSFFLAQDDDGASGCELPAGL